MVTRSHFVRLIFRPGYNIINTRTNDNLETMSMRHLQQGYRGLSMTFNFKLSSDSEREVLY